MPVAAIRQQVRAPAALHHERAPSVTESGFSEIEKMNVSEIREPVCEPERAAVFEYEPFADESDERCVQEGL